MKELLHSFHLNGLTVLAFHQLTFKSEQDECLSQAVKGLNNTPIVFVILNHFDGICHLQSIPNKKQRKFIQQLAEFVPVVPSSTPQLCNLNTQSMHNPPSCQLKFLCYLKKA